MIVMGSELLCICPIHINIYIYTAYTVSTFSYARCGNYPPPLCCLNMNVLNQKIQLLTFKSSLNDRKLLLLRAFQVLAVFFKFVSVSWSTFVLCICRMKPLCDFSFSVFYIVCLHPSMYCTFTLFYT